MAMPTPTPNPHQVPTEIGLSRDNIEAICKAYFTAKYKLKPGQVTFGFSWKQFTPELVITMKK